MDPQRGKKKNAYCGRANLDYRRMAFQFTEKELELNEYRPMLLFCSDLGSRMN